MRRTAPLVGLGVLLAVLALESSVACAQSEDASPGGAPIILVVDGASGRLSVTRLRRTLEAVLARPVVRPADERAATAGATLTIAFSAPHRWVVRFDEGGAHPTRSMDVRGPALEMLVGLAVDAVGEARTSGAAEPTPVAPPSSASAAIARMGSEILDPFVGVPVSRVTIAVLGELIDPFSHSGGALRVIGSPEVLDPWR